MFLTSEHLLNKHGFSTRKGGEDLERVKSHLGASKLVTLKQTHSDIAHIISGSEQGLEGDALVTDKAGIAIGVFTADCVPILLEDAKNRVIAAVHAGWKGARFGVIGSAIRTMQKLGAQEITAVIGPCIQKNSYEVREDFLQVFASETAANSMFFSKGDKEGHFMFDLPAYVKMKLEKNGIENIFDLQQDTLSQPEIFHSFRRSTIEGKTEKGRQISAICI